MDTGADVADRQRRNDRRAVFLTDQTRDSRVSLPYQIEAWIFRERAGLAEGRYRAHHDPWIELAHFGIAKAEPRDRARGEVFDQNVDLFHQFAQDLRALGIARIETEAHLAQVVLDIVTASIVAHVRNQPGAIAVRSKLDLDNLGAHRGH